MTARTHDVVAFASLLTVAALYPPQNLNLPTTAAAIVANIVGSLLPDIDQAGNRLWDLLPAGNFLGRVFRRLFISHRTLSHSILGIILFYYLLTILLPMFLNPSYINPNLVLAAIMIGYLSHIATDSLTKEGVPLLFPLKFEFGFPPLSFLRIKTGGFIENFIFLPAVAVYIFWFIGKYQLQLISLLQNISK
jgi:inner membrane protein